MNDVIELSNIEVHEHCLLNIMTGEKRYNKGKKEPPYFTGVYYEDANTFFELYPTKNGPMMYFEGKEYQLNKSLNINLRKMGAWREFRIEDYDIYIRYRTSPYIGFDAWSNEKDIDLFYQIEQSYKDEEYYKKFTK